MPEKFTPPHIEPYQRQCCDFIKAHPKCGIFLDVGYGKTLTTLQAVYELKLRSILVIAPKAIARTTWHKEIKKWGYPFDCYSMIEKHDPKTNKAKEIPLKDLYDLYKIIPYAKTQNISFFITTRDRVYHLVNWCEENKIWPFDLVICDEFQSFKDAKNRRTKAVMTLSEHTPRLIGLTGTPMPKGLEDIWAEIKILDNGTRLGKSITRFREAYMHSTMIVQGHNVGWVANPGAEQVVFNKIADIAISINANLNLPSLTINDMPVTLDPDEYQLYKKFAKSGVFNLEDVDKNASNKSLDTILTPANAAVLASKLLQIASGTVYDDAHNVYPIHDKKLAMLQYICDNTGGPVLVAYKFRCDEKRILENINPGPDEKIVKFDGSEYMQDEWNKGHYKIMLIQPASCCHGINLQDGGSCLVWYTLPDSYEYYKQTNGRLYRKGQTKPVVIHRLLAENTFDLRVARALSNKGMNNDILLEAVRRELEELN